MDERAILFVGDIQGCPEELQRLLERAGFVPGRHRLVALGDVLNRGPDAPAVLDLLAQAGAEPIVGNHELGMLQVWRSGEVPAWARGPYSAYDQLAAAGRWDAAMADIAGWPLVREGPDWIAVHAGLHPKLPWQQTDPWFLTEVRFCDADGRRPHGLPGSRLEPPAGFRPWFEHYRGGRTVIFGHWARLGLIVRPRLRGLDTGCVYGRTLTGLWWPEDRLVQVPAVRVHYRHGTRHAGRSA